MDEAGNRTPPHSAEKGLDLSVSSFPTEAAFTHPPDLRGTTQFGAKIGR
jgi:hypothetical protein